MRLPERPGELLLLHNPRCSKSRAARELLLASGRPFAERRYLDEPLDLAELRELRRRLGLPPLRWMRPGEEAFRRGGLGPDSSERELLDAVSRHPILLERPILVSAERAVVGRPPERVLELLGGGA